MDPRGKSEFTKALLLTVLKLKRKTKEKSASQQILVFESPSLPKANLNLSLDWKISSTCSKKFIELLPSIT